MDIDKMDIDKLSIEIALFVLLFMTLAYVMRLRTALKKVKAIGSHLRIAVEEFDNGTRAAESAVAKMSDAAKMLSGQLSHVTALRDDLLFLSERGETLADRLDASIRAARAIDPAPKRSEATVELSVNLTDKATKPANASTRVLSQAERSLLTALKEQH